MAKEKIKPQDLDLPPKNVRLKKWSPLSDEQKAYIIQASQTTLDKDVAKSLNIDIKTVRRYRKKAGIHKDVRGRVNKIDKPQTSVEEKQAEKGQKQEIINSEQRKNFYKRTISNSLYYSNLKEQFSKDEIAFYLEEWGSLCIQFEDILATEKRQIDEYIKAEILGNRILRNIKVTEDELAKLIPEIEAYRKSHDMANDDEAQERDATLMQIVRSCSAASGAMANDYQKNVDLRNRILEELNARRTDRADQISRRGTTFMSLVEEFRNEKVREEHGRHIELLKLAKERKQAQWRNPQLFPDGTKDCVLIDEHTNFPEKEFSRVEDMQEIIDKNYESLYVYKNDNSEIDNIMNAGVKTFTAASEIPNGAVVLLGLKNLELLEELKNKNVKIVSYYQGGDTTYDNLATYIRNRNANN